MKLLVLVADYPNNDGSLPMTFVHTRNLHYIKKGIDVKVLSFRARTNYIIDNIPVITYEDYKNNINEKFDVLVCHAPNIRNHYLFLKRYQDKFKKIVFIFHGHEVLKINEAYPVDYAFKHKNKFFKYVFQNIYDSFKLTIWRYYLPLVIKKSHFIFVSKNLFNDFLHYVKISEQFINNKTRIIYNGVGSVFEKFEYDKNSNKKYNFITIRSNLDSSTYCVDIVNNLAKKNPDLTFLLIGQGNYFEHYEKASNITLENKFLKHNEIIELINQSKYALMPTRRDSQGLMACEMATFGIPLITSDIAVCKEVFEGFDNVYFIDNDSETIDLTRIIREINNKQ